MSAPRLLAIQHEDECPPAWFGEWLVEDGAELDVICGYRDEAIPADLDEYDGLVVLGGEMGAHDDATSPWLTPTKALISHAIASGTWFLGICLGHQLAAVALGGEVIANPHGKAVGLTPVSLTAAGRADELTSVISDGARSLQWNVDIVSRLPEAATRLATAPDGSVQAARYGPRAWGVQFHPEASAAIFDGWITAASQPTNGIGGIAPDLVAVAAQLLSAEAELRRDWAALARRWADLVASPVTVP